MKSSSLNVIRYGVAAGLCLSLLAACDGRGTTAFKSYREDPQDYAERTVTKAQAELRGEGATQSTSNLLSDEADRNQ